MKQPNSPVDRMRSDGIRLEALRLAMSPRDIPANFDPAFYIAKAAAFEAYIHGGLAKKEGNGE